MRPKKTIAVKFIPAQLVRIGMVLIVIPGWLLAQQTSPSSKKSTPQPTKITKISKSDAEWKKLLTPEQYDVTRQRGTERAFKNKYWDNTKTGIYTCVCCGLPLFEASAKYKSGTGWPSFYQPVIKTHVAEVEDRSFFTVRTEVVCRRCDAHLGHMFNDGPKPTGLRYCVNSAALRFKEEGQGSDKKAGADKATPPANSKSATR